MCYQTDAARSRWRRHLKEDNPGLLRVLPSSRRKQQGRTQQPLFKAPQLHPQGVRGFQKISLYSPGVALPHRRFHLLSPPLQECDSPVSNGDISFPNYSGSIWLHNTWGCGGKGRREGKARLQSENHSCSPPHRYVALNFRTTYFWTS